MSTTFWVVCGGIAVLFLGAAAVLAICPIILSGRISREEEARDARRHPSKK